MAEHQSIAIYGISGGAKIELPPLIFSDDNPYTLVVALSPPPNYIVSFICSKTISLFRLFDSNWIQLKLPRAVDPLQQTVSSGGKQYYLFLYSYDLLVVDALVTPATFQYIEMLRGWSQMPKETGCIDIGGNTYIVEFDGKPSLVKKIVKGCTWITVGFELLGADLNRKMWARVESIGDKVLRLVVSSVSLLAADIGGKGVSS